MHRAHFIAAIATALLVHATTAGADEEAPEDEPEPRGTLALRPAFVVPFGRLDGSRMNAAPGGGLDAEASLRALPRVDVGLVVGATLSPVRESNAADVGERTGSVTSYRLGAFVEVLSSRAPLAVYGRVGAAYRLLVQRVSYAATGSSEAPMPAEHHADFYDGAEIDLGGGVALSTGSFRIEPGLDVAVCRLWDRSEPKGPTSGPAYFAGLGVRGAFDIR